MHDVDDVQTSHEDEVVSEQTTMAPPPQRLAAHHDRRLARGECHRVVDAREECVCLHVVGIAAECIVTECYMLRSGVWDDGARPARASRRSRTPLSGSPLLHLLTAELRVVATAGEGPHINDASDICGVEQRRERFGAQRAVPDGAQLGHDGPLFGRAFMMPEYGRGRA